MNLPKGIYYETARRRYRVRLYQCRAVVWHTYHTTLDEAQSALPLAQAAQRAYVKKIRDDAPPATVLDAIKNAVARP